MSGVYFGIFDVLFDFLDGFFCSGNFEDRFSARNAISEASDDICSASEIYSNFIVVVGRMFFCTGGAYLVFFDGIDASPEESFLFIFLQTVEDLQIFGRFILFGF